MIELCIQGADNGATVVVKFSAVGAQRALILELCMDVANLVDKCIDCVNNRRYVCIKGEGFHKVIRIVRTGKNIVSIG